MKKTLLFVSIFLGFSQILQAQTTVLDTFNFDGYQRDYILYVPAIYDGSAAVPLVINLHGYGSNATQQSLYGNFKNLADVDNFLVVHLNGTNDLSGTRYWNAFVNAGAVDDVAFINELIDRLSATYNIDQSKVFSTGMSNGGYMSYKLACELDYRIAKIASVTGSMNSNLFNNCAPGGPVPVMQIHGTSDLTVPYNGSTGVASIEDVVDKWVAINNCDTTPMIFDLPDINTNDNCTAQRYTYANGTDDSEVILYKITDGGHTWPNAIIELGGNNTNRDFDASQVIWEFFKGEPFVGIRDHVNQTKVSMVYQNNILKLSFPQHYGVLDILVFNSLGQMVYKGKDKMIDTSNWHTGYYRVYTQTPEGVFNQAVIKFE